MPSALQNTRVTPSELNQVHRALKPYGGSFLGAHQLMNGQWVTSGQDRLAIAAMVGELLQSGRDTAGGDPSGRRIHKPLKIKNAVVTTSPFTGLSSLGAQQLVTGQSVTSALDRQGIAALVCELLHGTDHISHKHISNVKYEDTTVTSSRASATSFSGRF